jgi:tRNA(Ile)-lysidine synthase TilS/MesJ
LLDFEKSEFDATDYFEDASNAENDYLRNRVRNLYLPAFEKSTVFGKFSWFIRRNPKGNGNCCL